MEVERAEASNRGNHHKERGQDSGWLRSIRKVAVLPPVQVRVILYISSPTLPHLPLASSWESEAFSLWHKVGGESVYLLVFVSAYFVQTVVTTESCSFSFSYWEYN